ncbi:MAG: molybdate ABC transporter substrate-binding protein [Alphaproteobacteria bacterium]|nr:molybdate ABC transporter substrate-binding protein [Alphaproteobacteria bacterium]
MNRIALAFLFALLSLAPNYNQANAAQNTVSPTPLRIAAASSLRPLEADLRAAWRNEQQGLHPTAETDSAHNTPELVFIFGASGSLATQISNGAPFDVLMSADAETPRQLLAAHLADPTSLTQFAYGRLVLLAAKMVDRPSEQRLIEGNFARLAIADPRVAPYGRAALDVIDDLKLTAALAAKIVQAGSVAKTYDLVVSQNVDLGFVALSTVIERRRGGGNQAVSSTDDHPVAEPFVAQSLPSNAWLVPEKYHAPIRHDAVAILQTTSHPLTKIWLQFLHSPSAKAVFTRYGYRVP